ncbi:MAG: sigma-54-dependent Fis family transcriptional regulator [Deltaproteobacteria bacterium]|nr:sigma-54-dependent Fis family transcriptional regulator [Deltaproteobacteria bacterium]
MTAKKLSSEERAFFRLVSGAALSNPFSDERTELDIRIAECPPDAPLTERLECVFLKMKERIEKLEKEGRADISLYSGDDRVIIQSTFLFEIFFIFTRGFDDLIARQIKAGESTCVVPFGRDAISLFIKRGFSPDDACRFFAILYQLKRAYYFVDKALIGQSPCMRDLRRHLWNNVFTYDIRLYERFLMNRMEDFSTMILGDTGTGKGTAAAAIGRSGFIPYNPDKNIFTDSFMNSFISINLSLYPETLIESELFGHKKGAFTGAINQHEGIFSRCRPHGSILLDEIGDVSLPVQLKLLQILQERTFSPVGSHEILRFNGRVIAATNKSIKELRGSGLFRSDFYYRLCSDCIVVPSLSERIQEDPDELRLILENIVSRLTGEKSEELVSLVIESLEKSPGRDYSWPGNVRELEQATRRILLTREYRGENVSSSGGIKEMLKNGIDSQNIDSQELISGYCALLYERYGTYEEVARRMNLDRRTVRRYIELYQG